MYSGYTDGGIVANNPSVIGVAKAMAHYPSLSLRNIVVLSIGAGCFPRHDRVFTQVQDSHTKLTTTINSMGFQESHELWRGDWGLKQWAPFLVDLLLEGDSVTIDMTMQYLLGKGGLYHRLDPRL